MIRQDLNKYNLPDNPGVYLFKKGRRIIYVGKATSLKDRVKSYFSKDLVLTRGPKLIKMVEEANGLEWQETASVLEALILEANLIKKHQPEANTRDKDDKSFNFVVITREDYPIVKTERGKALLNNEVAKKYKYIFGPYPYGLELREALKIIRRIFPFRDEKCHLPASRQNKNGRPCFNRQIGLCAGTCTGEISKKEYAKVIRSLRLFFEGKKDRLIKDLTRHMNRLAKVQKFEEANEFKKKIFALQHIQDVALLKNRPADSTSKSGFRIEAYDIAHLSGQHTVGAMVVMEDGELKKSDYRKFQVKRFANKSSTINDTENLSEILERRFKHEEWPLPNLIVCDGSTAQMNITQEVLGKFDLAIPVVGVVKDERHRARELKGKSDIVRDYHRDIVAINAEAHRFAIAYHRHKRDKGL